MTRARARDGAARAVNSDVRRSELLDATRRVIRSRGFAGATVGEITREAGASLGLLHYHFASKDDVVAEAFAESAREELAELADLAHRYADPPARLAAYLDFSEWTDTESWRMWVDAWGEAVHAETLRTTLEDFARGWRAVLAGVLADGDRRDCWRCPDPDDVAGRLSAAIDGIGLHATLHPGEVPPAIADGWARRLAELELGVELPGPPRRAAAGRAPTPHEARIAIRGRDLDDTGRVHLAVLLTYLGEAREAWLEARLGPLGTARPEVARVSADFRHVPAGRGGEVIARCALHGLGERSVRTVESIETVAGAVVVSAGATVVVAGDDGEPRALTAAEREALSS
jgi:AcrR family transcriptional regulator